MAIWLCWWWTIRHHRLLRVPWRQEAANEIRLRDSQICHTQHRSHTMNASTDLAKLKWIGWLILGSLLLTLSAWFAGEVVANGRKIVVLEERQRTQYLQLREDFAECSKRQQLQHQQLLDAVADMRHHTRP